MTLIWWGNLRKIGEIFFVIRFYQNLNFLINLKTFLPKKKKKTFIFVNMKKNLLYFIILNNVLCLNKKYVFMFPFFFFFYCVPVCCAVAGNHIKLMNIIPTVIYTKKILCKYILHKLNSIFETWHWPCVCQFFSDWKNTQQFFFSGILQHINIHITKN